MKINVRFERDKTTDDIDVVIRAAEKDDQIVSLIEKLSTRESVKLTVLDRNNCSCVIDEDEIVFVSADSKYVRVTATSGIYCAKQSLQSIEELLSRKFLRVSRFELINLSMVRKYDFTIGGTLRIEFENGMETWASRRYIPIALFLGWVSNITEILIIMNIQLVCFFIIWLIMWPIYKKQVKELNDMQKNFSERQK